MTGLSRRARRRRRGRNRNRPAQLLDYAEFQKVMLRKICASMAIPYHLLIDHNPLYRRWAGGRT